MASPRLTALIFTALRHHQRRVAGEALDRWRVDASVGESRAELVAIMCGTNDGSSSSSSTPRSRLQRFLGVFGADGGTPRLAAETVDNKKLFGALTAGFVALFVANGKPRVVAQTP